MAISEISVSKIYVLATEPTNKVKDRFWFDTTNNLLKRYDGTSWKPISVSSDDVVVLSSGNKVSLTNYLNTQIAALAEGIDSKQDKLKYYSEVSGNTPSATISVKNIKLKGSVAEGYNTTASGTYSHAEGIGTTASGHYSHAEGSRTTASDLYSHAEGSGTIASKSYQHVQGKYNIEDANDKYADIIGNGSSTSARSNAATVSWDGISWSQTDVRAGGTDQDNATYSLSALAEGIDSKQDKLKKYTESTDFGSIIVNNGINSIGEIKVYNPETPNNPTITLYTECDETTSNSKLTLSDKEVSIASVYNGDSRQIATNVNTNKDGIQLKVNTQDDYGADNYINIGDATININVNTGSSYGDISLNSYDVSVYAHDIHLDAEEISGTAILTAISDNPVDTKLVSEKAIKTELDKKQNKITTSTEISITPTASQVATSITGALAKPARVIVTPNILNSGAMYIKESSTYSSINPIYPDPTNNVYEFTNMQNVKVFADNVGDSLDLVIEYRG